VGEEVHEVNVVNPRSRAKRTWKQVVEMDMRNMKAKDGRCFGSMFKV